MIASGLVGTGFAIVTRIPFALVEVLTLVGMVGMLLAAVGFLGSKRSLVALRDPRLSEALQLENI
jgi:hypothetical protein